MRKDVAIELLGGAVCEAARSIGVSSQAVSQWPDPISRTTEDRVLAALTRRYLGEAQLIAIARAAIAASKRPQPQPVPRMKVLSRN